MFLYKNNPDVDCAVSDSYLVTAVHRITDQEVWLRIFTAREHLGFTFAFTNAVTDVLRMNSFNIF
jgi:hypothetical protein